MRFFFYFRQGGTLFEDNVGIELPTTEHAFLLAYEAVPEIWKELMYQRSDPRCCAFEVQDDRGNLLFALPFAEVLESCAPAGDLQSC